MKWKPSEPGLQSNIYIGCFIRIEFKINKKYRGKPENKKT